MRVSFLLSLAATTLIAAPAAAHYAGFKSPASGMHFTEGQPIVVYADLFDSREGKGKIVCPGGQTISNTSPPPDYGPGRPAQCSGGGTPTGWPQLQLLVDGVPQTDVTRSSQTVPNTTSFDHNLNSDPIDYFPFVVRGVPVGTHQFVVRGLFSVDAVNVTTQDSAPIVVVVDPMPAKTVVRLDANLTGAVNWDNVIVIGNGRQVMASGNIVIRNSLVTGVAGISGSVTGADIQGSIFEDVGLMNLTFGTGTVVIARNEWRANNRLAFVPNNPEVPDIIQFGGGSGANPKLFQGNRVGAGRIRFSGSNWMIGGDTDEQSNIFIGPRCVLNISATRTVVRGNYSHHTYRGGWSQGFNYYLMGAGSDLLIEHNFIRDGSWPVQNLAGEFRYNVVFGYGHTWVRSASSNASIHHNLFTPPADGGSGSGIECYSGESGLTVYNNTFDSGGTADGDFYGPTIAMSGGSVVSSLRNNLITFSRNQQNTNPGYVRVDGGAGAYTYADYNAFYSPDNTNKMSYDFTGGGAHDVSGTGATGVTDGQLAASPFAGSRITVADNGSSPTVDDSAIWNGLLKVSYLLATFRSAYAPKAGSPIIDTGDPQDTDSQGRRADIGAIDATGHDLDKLGKFGMPPSELVPPTVMLTAPEAGALLTGNAVVSATASDNPGGSGVVLVQFLVDGGTVGQASMSPYSVTFNSATLPNGDHEFSAKAWDAAGNSAVSNVVMARTMNAMIVVPPTGTGGASGAGQGAGQPGASRMVVGGCGCAVHGSGGVSAVALLLLSLVGLLVVSSRSRGPRRPRP